MKSFNEAINEGKASFEGMNFVINAFNDRNNGIAIQFIPDSKTLDNFTKNQQVDAILPKLKKNLPDFAETLWFESGHGAAGLIFRLDTRGLADLIEKALKK